MTRYTETVQFTGRYTFRFATIGWVAVLLIIGSQANATPVPAGATVIIEGKGFESPDYSIGNLEGQAAKLPNDAPFPGFQAWVASGGTTSTAVVQSTTAHGGGGSQAVQVDRVANEAAGGGRWAVPVSGWPSERFVCIEWDMLVDPTTGPSGTFGPFFGVEGYDDDGVGASNGLLGSMGVDASTGDVLYQETVSGNLTETGSTVPLGEWNHFHIDFDFALHEYSVILNGVSLVTEPFVDGAGLDQFTDGDIAAVAAAGDAASQALTGTAYFDNYVVYQLGATGSGEKIPEPSTLLLALFALVGLPRMRKGSL